MATSRPRFVLISQSTLNELAIDVAVFLNEVPRYEPTGGPFHVSDGTPGGTWYQAVYWKESDG